MDTRNEIRLCSFLHGDGFISADESVLTYQEAATCVISGLSMGYGY